MKVPPSSIYTTTNQCLPNSPLIKDYSKRIIHKLNTNKACDHGIISLQMLKMSGKPILEPHHKLQK